MKYVLVHHNVKDYSKLIFKVMLLIIIFNSAFLQAIDKRKTLFLKNKLDGVKPDLSFVKSPSEKESLNQTFADGIIYTENFDYGAPGWTIKDFWSESSWHVSTTGSLSGNSYWCGIEELGGYDDQWQHTLISSPIILPVSSNLSLFPFRIIIKLKIHWVMVMIFLMVMMPGMLLLYKYPPMELHLFLLFLKVDIKLLMLLHFISIMVMICRDGFRRN